MAKITFIEKDGTKHIYEGEDGMTLMELALRHGIPNIDADCGGACACATCHVYIHKEWQEKTGTPSEAEEDMLDFAVDLEPTSRLSCQIKLSDALDGLVVEVPERQS